MKTGTTMTCHPCRGDRFETGVSEKFGGTTEIKVMAVADNWAMVRRKGCVPFCIFVNDLFTQYRLIHPTYTKKYAST